MKHTTTKPVSKSTSAAKPTFQSVARQIDDPARLHQLLGIAAGLLEFSLQTAEQLADKHADRAAQVLLLRNRCALNQALAEIERRTNARNRKS